MRHLLDVNALIALAHDAHEHHTTMLRWYGGLSPRSTTLATSPITELGFVRVSVQVKLQPDVATAVLALAKLKSGSRVPFEFLVDDQGAEHLPAQVRTAPQVTDGHLVALAKKNGFTLATLDRGIPGATLIS